MKKRSSFLVIAAAVMLLALSAAPVLDLIRNDNDGDTSLSKFEGYTPISSPADLAKIGNSYPLNGKYYLTDNITFGPNDDKNGGMNMRISVSIDSGYLKFQLLSASGSTLFNTMSWSLYVDGVYVTGSKINTISMPVPTAGTHSFVLGGIIYDTGSQNTKYEFAYAREIRTNGSSMTPVTFNISSNGNFNPIENFTGIFDGNGYKISGLDIRRFSDGSELSMGFFKNIAPGAKVENLGLVDGSVTVLYKPEWKEKLYVGGIAGTSSGYIGNCYNSLNITVVSTTETSIGGIVGLMSTEATICYNTGNISALVTGAAELHVGGIAGGLEPYTTTEASASKCFNTGSIDARSTTSIVHAGGILGHASAAAQVLTISDCYNTGSINAKANYFGYSGGILGYTHNTTKISNCYSVGQITSTQVDALNYSGGIVGYSISAAQVSLVNCYYPENYAKEIVRGYATLDGSSSPARKADQGSGPKSVNSMRPTLQDAYAGTSVYYTGTTTVNGKTVKGWDFAGTWTIIKGVNDGFPILNRTAVISGTVKFIDNTPLAGVEIVYTLDGASYVPVITDSAGKYSVPVPVGCEFEFKDLRKNGLVLKGGLPDPFTISIDREYNFIMDYDPDHEFRISGTVTFNGTGMGGVDIWYTVDNGTPKKATTETDGTYLIEEKVYTTVRITNIDPNDPIYKVNSHSYDKFAMTEDHENINFTLRYNEDLTLNVKGAVTFGGSPVNGAVVTYKINGTQSSVMTDASGMYTINVHPGDNFAFVSVTSASGALKYSGTMPSFTVTGNATHNFVLDYDKTKKFTVSGKLTAEGAPVAGGVVTYAHGGAEHKVISDASGNYSIDVYAGDNFAFVSVASASGGLKFTGTLPSFTVLDNEIHNFSLDYDKTKKFTVSGNVTMNGTPLDGAIVKYTINGVAGLVKTNAGGSYTISVNSGDVFVFISVTSENEALKYTGKMPAFTVSDDEMHNFALNYDTTKKYTVSGKVTFGGTPLSGAVVTYTIGGIGYTKTTDASGNYSIDVYSGDKFVFVSVLSADLAYAFPGSLPSFTVIGNEIHNFALDYNKGISFIVSGTVTLNGAPVSGAVVTYSIDGAQSSVMTDASGKYTIDVHSGDVFAFISVRSANDALKYTGTMPSFTVSGNATHNFSLDYDTTMKYTVSGNVTMNGAALDGAIVKYTINGTAGLIKTNAAGYYSIPVYSGDEFVFISVTSANDALKYSGTMPSFTVSGDATHNFSLDYDKTKKFTVSGTVTLNGAPINGAVVTYKINGTQSSVPTDTSGKYTIDVYSGDVFAFISVKSDNGALKYSGTMPSFTVSGNETRNFALDYDTTMKYTVSGTVTMNGAPLGAAVVTYKINGAQSSVPTDTSGKYTIDVYSGDVFVFISVTSANGALKYFDAMPSFTVSGNETHDFALDYDTTKKYTVSGIVTMNGAPLDGAIVTYKIGTKEYFAVTNASGHYAIDVHSGDEFVFISVTSANGALKYFDAMPSFTVSGDETHNFALDYDTTKEYTVSGTVTMNGAPLGAAVVTYKINGIQSSVSADASGKYTIDVHSGDEFVFISVTSANEALKYFGTMPSFTVSGDETHNFALDYDTTKSYTISGTVTFDGAPVKGAVVTYTIGGVGYITTSDDDSDKYSVVVNSGDKFVFVSVKSDNGALMYFGTMPSFTVSGDATYDFELDYKTDESFIVSGKVTFNDLPYPGAVIKYTINGVSGSVGTDDDGYYNISVKSGDIFVFISVTSANEALKFSGTLLPFTVSGNATYNFALDYDTTKNFSVSGKVTVSESAGFVFVKYTINGTEFTAGTNASRMYWIDVYAGDEFAFVSITSDNEAFKYFGPLPSFTVIGDAVYDFTLDHDTTKKFTVSGIVTFNGTLLEGAVVTYRIDGVQSSVLTDGDGKYTIDVNSGDNFAFDNVASANGAFKFLDPLPSFIVSGNAIHDFALNYDTSKKFTVSGTVTFDGEPVPGAVVTYTIGGVGYTKISDALGKYSIDVYSGDEFAFVNVTSANEALKCFDAMPSFTVSGDETYDFVLDHDTTKSYTISGTVTFDGAPVNGVVISYEIFGTSGQTATDASGKYTIDVNSGDEFAFVSIISDNEALKYFGPLPSFTVSGDATYDFELNYDTTKSYTISGTVTFDGEPVPGAVVTYTIGGVGYTKTSDASGKYSIDVYSGDEFAFVNVTSANEALKFSGSLPSFTVSGDATYDFELNYDTTKSYTISGTVTFNGASVNGVVISYEINGTFGQTATDGNGYYVIPVNSGDEFAFVSIISDNEALKCFDTMPSFTVSGDATYDFVLDHDTTKSYTISGTVTFDGEPIKGAVVAYTIGGVGYTKISDALGKYSIDVNSGDEFAFVSITSDNEALSYFGSLPSFTVTGNAVHDFALNYDTAKSFTISGTVTFNGAAVSGVVISYEINGTPGQTATDGNGYYEISVNAGDEFEFVSVLSAGDVYQFNGTLPSFVVSGDATYDFELGYNRSLSFTLSGTVTKTGANGSSALGTGSEGIAIRYTVNGGEPQTALTDSGGNYIIIAKAGDMIKITEIETGEDYGVVGDLPDEFHMISDQEYDFELQFIGTVAENGGLGWLWLLIPAFLTFCTLLYWSLTRRTLIVGTVKNKGDGAGGAQIEYRVDGETRTVTTEEDGSYSVKVKKGANVEITSVSKEGAGRSTDIPGQFRKEKGVTKLDFSL